MSDAARRTNVNQLLADAAKFAQGLTVQLQVPENGPVEARVRELDSIRQRALAHAAALELVADRCGDYAGLLLDESDEN